MIAFFALRAATTPVKIAELIDPSQNRITIQTLVSCEELGARDRDDITVMAKAFTWRTLDFTRNQMAVITGGRPVESSMTPAGLRFSLSVDPNQLSQGMALMFSLIAHPTFDEEDFTKASEKLTKRTVEGWSRAFDRTSHVFRNIKAYPAQQLFERIFRPENITIAVGGKFDPNTAKEAWAKRSSEWNLAPKPQGYFDISKPTDREYPGLTLVVEPILDRKMLSNLENDTVAKFLAVFALGVGKDASFFRVIREQLSVSYRQEYVFIATPSGLEPRWIIASTKPVDLALIRTELGHDIDAWNEDSRTRAIAMANGVWKHRLPWEPIVASGQESHSDLEDRTFLSAYWTRLTGSVWDEDRILKAMSLIDLEKLKSAAKDLIQ